MPSYSSLSTLLLLLLLFHSGLQSTLRPQGTSQVPLNVTRTVNCSELIGEILQLLNSDPEKVGNDDKAILMSKTLWRENLDAFLDALTKLNLQHIEENIRKNLETLKFVLPNTDSTPKGDGIGIEDKDDFKKKLSYYLIELDKHVGPKVISIPFHT